MTKDQAEQYEKAILELIDQRGSFTRSDLQAAVAALVKNIAGTRPENTPKVRLETRSELNRLIEKVKGKLESERIDFRDYDKAIECLKKTVAPKVCIRVYRNYINC